MIIDSHAHLWQKQQGRANNTDVFHLTNGISVFDGEMRQMMPPFMTDGINSVERLIANMNYAGVSGAVITQEEIDGNQNEYLKSAKLKFKDRLKICSLYEENKSCSVDGFDGIKLCSGRFSEKNLLKHFDIFKKAADNNKFISIDLADGDAQTKELNEIAVELPDLKIAIGHFGMVTRKNWKEQIKLAQNKNIYIESGGITWLFNNEFYPYPSAVKAISEAAQICSFDKLMWGSDYPRTMVEITYKMSFDFILKSNDINESDKEKMLYKNASEFYGFENLTVPQPVKNML